MSATLSLTNVESLSYQRTTNFLGDIFAYNSTDSYTVKARVAGDPNLNSIRPGWTGVNAYSNSGFAYLGFVVDGIPLGTGKITSLNWEGGVDLQSKKYTMSFEIANSGNLYNLTGSSYQELDSTLFSGDFKYVNDLSESFSINVNSNGIQETSQDVSFGIDNPLTSGEKIYLKNRIFSGFAAFRIPNIGIRTVFPNIITGSPTTEGYITYYNETIDNFNSRYSFNKKSTYDNNPYATWEYGHTVQLNGNNVVVAENGTIQSVYFQGTGLYKNLSGARERWTGIVTGIYKRASGTFQALSGLTGLFGNCNNTLINLPISKSWQENPIEGSISYSWTYTSDPTYSLSGYIFSNQRGSSVDEDGYFLITEGGQYQGISESPEQRFDLAYSGYLRGVSGLPLRISGAFVYAGVLNKALCPPTGNFYLTNESKTFREFDGIVKYDIAYSNNPSYYPTNSNFIKIKNTISDTPPVHLYNKFLVPRQDEYIQSAQQSTPGSWGNSIKIFGKTGVSIQSYLNEAFTKVIPPSGSGILSYVLQNIDYSFNPFENSFNANFEYYYSRYKRPGDIFV